MAFDVEVERFVSSDVRDLVMKLDEQLLSLDPPEANFGLTFEEMARADVVVFVCRDASHEAVAMGTLKIHEASLGEVKRMYTEPALRGRGLGQRILGAIVARARDAKLAQLVLETGTHGDYGPAWALYERLGFTECGPVLDYSASEHSRFYEKTL